MHAEQTASTQANYQQLQGQLVGVIKDLEPIQKQLLALYQEKSKALKQVDVKQIDRLALAEEELTRELQFVLLRRQQLLQSAEQQGLPSGSLQELLTGMGVPESAAIFQQIEEAQERSKKLRHESWVQWIVSQRSYQHYSQILELIAHSGQKVPTYSHGQNESSTGGAIFDASA
ncbi:flagellar export chaperone FlgN [Gimesia fumaroli]|uniref:FlgN protein n=1 Tax=Gimesia fumaroli TaxID=2527976 RepID=A0A518I7B0_9PLAN|nr:flagellar export chaperone FlgN [Gimesia fumaroli]QDV48978.1 FlgN protein [Gimesia fumaroli]